MMTDTTPEIDAILDDLTELCCQSLQADGTLDQERVDQLTKSLSTNGWDRHQKHEEPLSVTLENRLRDSCKEPAIHRGAEVQAVVAEVQASFDRQSRYQASSPETDANKSVKNGAWRSTHH